MRKKTLSNKRIVLGVCGSIAAPRALDLSRRLREAGARVDVVATSAALRFVTPLSLEVASGNPVHSSFFEDPVSPIAHIDLGSDADLVLVAPATAQTIARLSLGLADDLLSAVVMAAPAPLMLAPAMNSRMYENPAFRENLERLKDRGVIEIEPGEGALACGLEGRGRMAAVDEIVEEVEAALSVPDLEGEEIIITAGPTREYLDPVRFISNRSSGKMGYALARVARRHGARVLLVSGPSTLSPPRGVEFIGVETAEAMRRAVIENLPGKTLAVMAAAVADFSPAGFSEKKLSKGEIGALELKPAPDILAEVGSLKERPRLIGFAAESGENVERARRKLGRKNCDLMVLNDISRSDAGFDADTNQVTIVSATAERRLPLMSKEEAAREILLSSRGV